MNMPCQNNQTDIKIICFLINEQLKFLVRMRLHFEKSCEMYKDFACFFYLPRITRLEMSFIFFCPHMLCCKSCIEQANLEANDARYHKMTVTIADTILWLANMHI